MRERRLPWAALLRRTWGVDALVCRRCGGPMRLVAAIVDPLVARRILAHLVNGCDGGRLGVDCGSVHETGCGGRTPGAGCPSVLSLDESRLVQGLSCPEIRIAGYCSIDKIHGARGSLRAQCIARDAAGAVDSSSLQDIATVVGPGPSYGL